MSQIPLTSQEEVQIVQSPPDADFLEVSRVLGKKTPPIRELADLVARGIVPMVFKTNRSVDGKEATLELIPQNMKPLPDGQGWSWRGLATGKSSFRKRGNRKDAPITEGVAGSAAVNKRFVVV